MQPCRTCLPTLQTRMLFHCMFSLQVGVHCLSLGALCNSTPSLYRGTCNENVMVSTPSIIAARRLRKLVVYADVHFAQRQLCRTAVSLPEPRAPGVELHGAMS